MRAWIVVAVAAFGVATVLVSANALFWPGVVFGYAVIIGALTVLYRALTVHEMAIREDER